MLCRLSGIFRANPPEPPYNRGMKQSIYIVNLALFLVCLFVAFRNSMDQTGAEIPIVGAAIFGACTLLTRRWRSVA